MEIFIIGDKEKINGKYYLIPVNIPLSKERKLLEYLIKNLRDEREFYLLERIFINDLGISKMTLYRWIDKLIKLGILEKLEFGKYRLKISKLKANGDKNKVEKKEYKNLPDDIIDSVVDEIIGRYKI